MSVFTVYNCGTGANRDTDDEVIASLAKHTAGGEAGGRAGTTAGAWMITDGVGKLKGKGDNAYMAGVHDPKTGKFIAPKGLRTLAKGVALVRGNVGGWGWEQNVEFAMDTIRTLDTLPTVINMAGWSRGAITCHKLAHALATDAVTNKIPVNIFAFDPVPGPGNFKAANITLPGNVQRYAVVQMEDDRRWIMKPMSFAMNPSAGREQLKKFQYYPMPGDHATGVMVTGSPVGMIGAAIASKFLTKCGTQLMHGGVIWNDLQYCELYAEVRLHMKTFRGRHGGFLEAIGSKKRRLKHQFSDNAFFINDHHRARFEKRFMMIYQYLQGGVPANMDPSRDIEGLRAIAPMTYRAMVMAGLIE